MPLWSGEVIHAYDQYNMFENMITSKSLTGGVTWEFPVTGVVGLNPSWNSGVELGAYSGDTNSTSSSFKVSLDKRPMAAHFETDNIDALITQWDFRSELARQSGITLANTRDKQLAVALLAACAACCATVATTAIGHGVENMSLTHLVTVPDAKSAYVKILDLFLISTNTPG